MLHINNLVKRFGGIYAINHVSIEILKNITLVMGPNGSGKTTLIRCISGIYTPDEGEIKYNDVDITGKSPHDIVKYGIVHTFQIPSPFKKLSVLENVLVSSQKNKGENLSSSIFHKKWMRQEHEDQEKAYKILKLLNIDHLYDQPALVLSGGQSKLLEISRALMTDAKVILMDEPIGGVNPVIAHKIFSHIRTLQNELQISFVIIEHRLDIAIQYVDYVYAMERGKIIFKGLPEKAIKDPLVLGSYITR